MGHKLNVPVHLKWPITTTCACPPELLFEPRIPWREFQGPFLQYRHDRPQSIVEFERALHTETTLKLRSPIYFETFHHNFPAEADVWIATNFDNYFVPQLRLKKKIASFSKKYIVGEMVGVHIRRGDKVGRVDNLPGIGSYFRAVDEAIDTGKRIFVATDDGGSLADSIVLRIFAKRYQKKLVYREKASVRRDALGIQEALIDLWLLRGCQRFIGTKCSTYSETVAIGRDAVLV